MVNYFIDEIVFNLIFYYNIYRIMNREPFIYLIKNRIINIFRK